MSSLRLEQDEHVKELLLKLPRELYHKLEEGAAKQGFSSVSDYIVHILALHLKPEHEASVSIEKLRAKLERIIQDEINKGLAVLESMRKQIVEIYERVDSLEQRVEAIESIVKELESRKAEVPAAKPRKTAIERLKEEKVLFESALPPRIQRDRLFNYLEREGAVVLKLSKERVAVDPEFWQEFKSKLNELRSTDEKEIQRILGDKGFSLWKTLYSENLIIYDPKPKKWRFVHGEAL